MKSILIVLLCMFSSFAYGQTIGQEIKKLQKEKKIFVIYDSSIRLDTPYHGPSLKNMPVGKALDKLFRNTDITWTRSGMNIILGRKPQKQSKQQPKAKVKKKNAHGKYTISGYIKNENGEPLVNATIYDKEEKQGTLTNEYGFFSFTLPEGTHSLRISYIGCQDIHPRIKLSGNERIDFQLQENTTLNDVIVKGDLNSPLLTTQTGKRSLTSADFNTEFSLLSSPDVI
ncbi:MAG: carboxypeptidase-like regulatory domain-containing protein, partial [Prevotella sp.]|nr:carboxypeptidase-like regulatory domain-containing protein [Prevotella sp.]